jgi:hypothetical protein
MFPALLIVVIVIMVGVTLFVIIASLLTIGDCSSIGRPAHDFGEHA